MATVGGEGLLGWLAARVSHPAQTGSEVFGKLSVSIYRDHVTRFRSYNRARWPPLSSHQKQPSESRREFI